MGTKPLSEWESYEAFEECIRRDSSAVARGVNMSLSLVQKWKEPPFTEEDYTQSGTRNPLDRIERIISTIERIDTSRAYIPLFWLCARFRFSNPIKLPQIESNNDIQKALLKWTKEFGETCRTVSQALEDNKVTGKEYKKIHREMMEDIAAGMALLQSIKKTGEP